MIGQDLAGFGGSKIQKILLLYAEKKYGMYYSIAGASSGGGKVTCKSAVCCRLKAEHQQTPSFLGLSESTSRCELWCLHLLKNTCLTLCVSNLSLKSSTQPV